MANQTKPDRQWPGAYERGLQALPALAPGVADLQAPEQHCWMNVLAAERLKGAPLSSLELSRIYSGRPWRSAAAQERLRRQQKAARARSS